VSLSLLIAANWDCVIQANLLAPTVETHTWALSCHSN
jgi:hypothetical protein